MQQRKMNKRQHQIITRRQPSCLSVINLQQWDWSVSQRVGVEWRGRPDIGQPARPLVKPTSGQRRSEDGGAASRRRRPCELQKDALRRSQGRGVAPPRSDRRADPGQLSACARSLPTVAERLATARRTPH